MRKYFRKNFMFFCAVLYFLMAFGLVGCNSVIGGYASLTPLTGEEIASIEKMCFDCYSARGNSEHPVNKVTFYDFYGEYGGMIVCKLKINEVGFYPTFGTVPLTIDGIFIADMNDSATQCYVYDPSANLEDSFILLEKAYENGTITKADLRQIAYYARQGE